MGQNYCDKDLIGGFDWRFDWSRAPPNKHQFENPFKSWTYKNRVKEHEWFYGFTTINIDGVAYIFGGKEFSLPFRFVPKPHPKALPEVPSWTFRLFPIKKFDFLYSDVTFG